MPSTEFIYYHEEQKFNQWWLWLILYATAALVWVSFIQQIVLGQTIGSPPPDWFLWLFWLLVGWGLPILFHLLKLIIEVRSDGIETRFFPLMNRRIGFDQIKGVEMRRYDPIKEFGGWGIKGWSKRRIAYNVSGNEGVELTLLDGRTVMLGSQKPAALAQALTEAMSHHG